MQSLFNPKSVAIIGASVNPNKWGNWAAEQALANTDLRNVYLVNPRGDVIYGTQSLKSIQEIPEPIDVAIVTVSLQLFESTVDALLAHGTKAIVGITVGFGERDDAGSKLEQRIAEKIHQAGSIFVGPNCAGVLDNHASFQCMPVLCPKKKIPPGGVGFISQSGGMITDVYLRLEEVGLNYSRALSVGNMAGLKLNDLVENLDNDPNTKIIALYLEHGILIPKSKKPLILLSALPTPAAKHAAENHTDSELIAFDNSTHNLRDFIAAIQAATSDQKGKGRRAAIVTDSGGMGIFAASECEKRGFIIDEPIDMIGIPSGFYEGTVKLMTQLQHSPDVDAIIMILFLIEAELSTEYETGTELATVARAGGKPVVFVCKKLDSPGARALLEANMPVYRDVDVAVKALEYLCG